MKDSIKTLRTMERKDKIRKIGTAITAAAITASLFAVGVFAAPATNAATDVVKKFLAYTVDIFVCVGALLGVWSVGQLALAFKNEDADSKSKAMMMLVVAAILIGVKLLADPIAQAAGFGKIGKGFLMSGMYTPLL